jgi:uncharacterized protein
MIHRYQNNGFNIVLDINSGVIHVMDDAAYHLVWQVEALIKSGMTEPQQITDFFIELFAGILAKTNTSMSQYHATKFVTTEMMSALAEILVLYEEGMLFTPDNYEDYITEIKERPTVVKALCLHVAHACNLACRYCFADEGGYHGEKSLMSFDIGKQALDFLIANSGNRTNLEVDFFGGEPLLNWEVVKQLVTYGRSMEEPSQKKFRFTLTTNGILLTEELFDFINKEMSNVVLSIDGRREVNDRMRLKPDGSGSYDDIIEKFQKLAESRQHKNYYVRGTFTRHNLDFTEDVLHLAEKGFKHISIEPAVSLTDSVNENQNKTLEKTLARTPDFAIRLEDLPAICAEYDRLAQKIIARHEAGQPINFFHFMLDLTGGPCVAKRLSGCGAGTEYLAVTPRGDLYPCHQFADQPEFLMGNVKDGVTATALYEEFKSTCVYTKPKCRDCFARFYCSGGCAANAHKLCGSITDCDEIGCTLQRKRVECAIMIKAALSIKKEGTPK